MYIPYLVLLDDLLSQELLYQSYYLFYILLSKTFVGNDLNNQEIIYHNNYKLY